MYGVNGGMSGTRLICASHGFIINVRRMARKMVS